MMLIMQEASFQQKTYLVILNTTWNKTVIYYLTGSVLRKLAYYKLAIFFTLVLDTDKFQ